MTTLVYSASLFHKLNEKSRAAILKKEPNRAFYKIHSIKSKYLHCQLGRKVFHRIKIEYSTNPHIKLPSHRISWHAWVLGGVLIKEWEKSGLLLLPKAFWIQIEEASHCGTPLSFLVFYFRKKVINCNLQCNACPGFFYKRNFHIWVHETFTQLH